MTDQVPANFTLLARHWHNVDVVEHIVVLSETTTADYPTCALGVKDETKLIPPSTYMLVRCEACRLIIGWLCDRTNKGCVKVLDDQINSIVLNLLPIHIELILVNPILPCGFIDPLDVISSFFAGLTRTAGCEANRQEQQLKTKNQVHDAHCASIHFPFLRERFLLEHIKSRLFILYHIYYYLSIDNLPLFVCNYAGF